MTEPPASKRRIVAIDGPAGVGKSTAARLLAERLGLPMLDTGAMYRAVALDVLDQGIDPADQAAVVAVARRSPVDVVAVESGVEVRLAGRPVEPRIRTPEVSETTSRISAYPEVRRRLVELQRQVGHRFGAVVEGRDIGTVVFPDTPYKFFLEARTEVRAARRHRELLTASGDTPPLEVVHRDIERRDARDRGRADSPLTHDETYVVVDTSELEPAAVVERMVRAIEEIARSESPRAQSSPRDGAT